MLGVLLEIVALEDERVARIDLAQLATAGAPDQDVDDVAGAGEQVFAGGALAREAERDFEVVTQQDSLAQLAVCRSGQKPGGDDKDAETARDQ